MSEWHQTFIRVLKRASRPDGRCTVKCMLLQKGAVNYCGCISWIEGAYIGIVGASAPTKRYKITPLPPGPGGGGSGGPRRRPSTTTTGAAVHRSAPAHLTHRLTAPAGRRQGCQPVLLPG